MTTETDVASAPPEEKKEATATKNKPNFSKLGTAAIQKNVDSGKYEGETLDAAKEVLAKRLKAVAKEKASPAAKKSAPKKSATKKAPAKKTVAKGKSGKGLSEYLRKIMTPKDGSKVCAVTYGEANKAIKEKFPDRTKLYPSEFDRNFEMLKEEGVLTSKQPPRFKTEKQVKAAKKAAAPKKKSAAKKKA